MKINYQSIKTNIFLFLIKRYSKIYNSATMNIYLHICYKLSIHVIYRLVEKTCNYIHLIISQPYL